MVVCVGFCEDGGDGARHNVGRVRDRRRPARPAPQDPHAARRGPLHDARRPPRRVRHAGRPDRDADLLRQGLPGGGAHADARRRRDPRAPCGAGRAARRTPRPSLHGRPPVAPRRAVGSRPRGRELAGRRLREPDRHLRLAATSSAARGSSTPAATSSPRPARSPAWRSRPSTCRRRSRRPAARCRRSATCAPTCTARPSRSRSDMPTVDFTLRWADGTEQRCQSPSTAIERFLTEGGRYPHHELLRRTRARPHRRERNASSRCSGWPAPPPRPRSRPSNAPRDPGLGRGHPDAPRPHARPLPRPGPPRPATTT